MATGGRWRASLRASGPWKVRRAGDGAELDLSQDRAASEAGRASGRATPATNIPNWGKRRRAHPPRVWGRLETSQTTRPICPSSYSPPPCAGPAQAASLVLEQAGNPTLRRTQSIRAAPELFASQNNSSPSASSIATRLSIPQPASRAPRVDHLAPTHAHILLSTRRVRLYRSQYHPPLISLPLLLLDVPSIPRAMFHVASRHAAPEALNLSSAHYQYPVEHKLNIPRRLARPSFSEPSRDAVARLDPGLAQVPLEYIRKMLAGNANECVLLPRSPLPER